jgi:hypothetical protein
MDNIKKLKTPCFNFYPESFLGGIRKMTDKEVGIYIKALCYQFNEGAIDEEEYQAFPKRVKDKFILTEKGYVNPRLEFERERKDRYKANRMKNLEGKPLEDRLKAAGVIK